MTRMKQMVARYTCDGTAKAMNLWNHVQSVDNKLINTMTRIKQISLPSGGTHERSDVCIC